MTDAGNRRLVSMTLVASVLVAATMLSADVSPEELNVYFGSLGARALGAPREDFERARIVDRLDFLGITSPVQTATLAQTASAVNDRLKGRFVALSGWTYAPANQGSHLNVLDVSNVIDETGVAGGSYGLFYRSWLPGHTDSTAGAPIVQFADPQDPAVDYGRLELESLDALRDAAAPYVRTIQIVSAAHTNAALGRASDVKWEAYLRYLNAGFRLAPTADPQRSVLAGGVKAEYRTAVLARHLTKVDILEGIRERRVYATEDRNLKVSFSINGHPMGSVVSAAVGTPLRIELTFMDVDEPDASYWISVRRDTPGGPLEAARELSGTDYRGDGRVVFTQFKRGSGDEYFLANIVQQSSNGTDSTWTAPVWLTSW